MRYAGIDIGSRTIKFAVLENGKLVFSRKSITSHDPLGTARELMEGVAFDRVTATGYGRHLIKGHLACPVVSEITAFVLGARFFSDDCGSVLDIGGQDTKAISLDENGNLCKFEMNDRCAAGTGGSSRSWRPCSVLRWKSSPRQRSRQRGRKRSTACVPSLQNPRSYPSSPKVRTATKWPLEFTKPLSAVPLAS